MLETQPVTLTSLAVDKLKEIMEDQGEAGSALRILMVPAGQGVQYMLSLEQDDTENDVAVHQDGIRLLLDRDTIHLLDGTSIDYHEDLMRAGFVINNPNIVAAGGGCGSGACGCGGGGGGCGGGGGACSCGGH